MFNHIMLSRLFLIGLVCVGIFTAIMQRSPDEVSLIPCLFHSVTDVPCPGCGMTRACIAITQANFIEAWDYHPFSYMIVALAVGMAFFPTQLMNTWMRFSVNARNLIVILGIVICLSVWMMKVKNIFW